MIYRACSHGYEHPYLVANFAQYHRRPPIVPFENFPPALSNKSKSFLIPPAPNSHKRPLHPFSLAVQQLHTCGSAHYTSLLRHTVYTLFKKNEKRGGGRNRRALLSLSLGITLDCTCIYFRSPHRSEAPSTRARRYGRFLRRAVTMSRHR